MSNNRRFTVKAVAVVAMGFCALAMPQKNAAASTASGPPECWTCVPTGGTSCLDEPNAEVYCEVYCGPTYHFADVCDYDTVLCATPAQFLALCL